MVFIIQKQEPATVKSAMFGGRCRASGSAKYVSTDNFESVRGNIMAAETYEEHSGEKE
jgi:hypothetical protein